jgi:hypothetical protein
MPIMQSAPSLEEVEEILDAIREYKLRDGYPEKQKDHFSCPYERHRSSKCMKGSKGWGGHGRLNTLV